ncbi:MAG: ABC transporter permease [Candidatus Vecturithrix sp.]|jgi:ribose transport system permease protein|nr:ABC transporter permease [Candidatus Vecturithrix sp.]
MPHKIIPIISNYGLFFILLLLIILSSILSPLFFSYLNITNVLIQSSFTGILAIGMTFVILTAGIDLSVGAIVGFSSILFASLLHGAIFTFMPDTIFIYEGAPKLTPVFPMPFNFVFVLCIGVLIGFLSGLMSYKLGIHSFIITLAVMIFTRGLAISYTHGQPLFGMPEYINFLAYGQFLRIPMPVIVWIIASLFSFLLLKYTRFGRGIYAVGGGEEAARLSGINPGLYRIFPFMASGFFSALVGVMMSGRMACGDPKIAEGWELDAIAAVVIGGTSLFGGRGGIGETVVGVLIMGLIINMMNLLEISAYPQQMVKGVIIILALASQNFMMKRSYT